MDAEDALGVYLEAMLVENQHLNLTGIRDPQEAHVLHVLDSLEIGQLGLAPRHCLDLGTGNGFPGIALCALFPEAKVTWMERTGKKLQALQRILDTPAVKAIGMPPPELLLMDAAQVPALRKDLVQHFDLVTARALAAPEPSAVLARPFLSKGGSLVLWLAESMPPELVGFHKPLLRHYKLPDPTPRSRCLARYQRT